MDFPSHTHIDDYVRRLLAEKQYRPTVIALVFRQLTFHYAHPKRKYLLVRERPEQQPQDHPLQIGPFLPPVIWHCPQGGIEPTDCEQPHILERAFARELSEELSLAFPEDLTMIEPLLHNEYLHEPERQHKGFAKGKHYFFGLIRARPDIPLDHSDDIAGCHWSTYQKAIGHFNLLRTKKALLLAYALERAEKFLSP